MKAGLVLAFLALVPATAAAQDRAESRCPADFEQAACAGTGADALARSYGVQTIDAHLGAGDAVVRVFFLNSRGENRLLIAFVRAAGREPIVSVHFPREGTGAIPPPMQAPVSEAAWNEATRRSIHATRSFVSSPLASDGFCLDPWLYVFEASEPARMGVAQPPRTRRHLAGNCDDAPLVLSAEDLQRLALSAFPVCNALDTEHYFNLVEQFLTCRILAGDRLAAADVVNRALPFMRVHGPDDGDALASLFYAAATVDWNGRRTPPGDEANPDEFWLARLGEDHADDFVIERAEGLSVDRVRLTGHLGRTVQGRNGTIAYRAPFEQIWTQRHVASAAVGPWTIQRGD